MIAKDSSGRELYPHVFRKIQRIGRQLEELGYREARSKPNLFVCRNQTVTFFADLRGTDDVPIFVDQRALWWRDWTLPPSAIPLEVRRRIIAIERLRLWNVPIRQSYAMSGNFEMFSETAMLIPQEAIESERLTPRVVRRLFAVHVYGRT
ncbi:MAG: hypothetical protein M0Z66_15170 [Thermaerobacter sp.]|nr:hypothetical protein [Thermaerobacter sp.]